MYENRHLYSKIMGNSDMRAAWISGHSQRCHAVSVSWAGLGPRVFSLRGKYPVKGSLASKGRPWLNPPPPSCSRKDVGEFKLRAWVQGASSSLATAGSAQARSGSMLGCTGFAKWQWVSLCKSGLTLRLFLTWEWRPNIGRPYTGSTKLTLANSILISIIIHYFQIVASCSIIIAHSLKTPNILEIYHSKRKKSYNPFCRIVFQILNFWGKDLSSFITEFVQICMCTVYISYFFYKTPSQISWWGSYHI